MGLLESGWKPLATDAAQRVRRRWNPRLRTPRGTLAVSEFATRQLSFLPKARLVRALYAEQDEGFGVFAVDGALGVYPLDGKSQPIHEAREHEEFVLSSDTVVEYLDFFTLFTHGDEGPFRIVRTASDLNAMTDPRGSRAPTAEDLAVPFEHCSLEEIERVLTPPRIEARSEDRGWQIHTCIQYGDALFRACFTVTNEGLCTLDSDAPLVTDIPVDERLNRVPPTVSSQSARRKSIPDKTAAPGRLPTNERRVEDWVVRTLIELRLSRVLHDGAAASLFEPPDGATSDELLRVFSDRVAETSPILLIESDTSFCEELVFEILHQHGSLAEDRQTYRLGGSSGDEAWVPVIEDGKTLLLSLHEARSIVAPEALAHLLLVHPIPVFVGCDSARRVPTPLRRIADATLALPKLDLPVFREAFCRLLDCEWPDSPDTDAIEWASYVIPQDFFRAVRSAVVHRSDGEAPDRSAGDWSAKLALTQIRDRVKARLLEIDPAEAPDLQGIHGLGEAKVVVEDLIEDIRAALTDRIDWEEVDRGLLLVGEPGTGKTMLARATAKACGVRFLARSAASWIAGTDHLGQHIAAIRGTFAEARRFAPCILFIDEIDSIGNREHFSGRNRQYNIEIVNCVLQELQGFEERGQIFVIAATNHENSVDPALRRAGRLDQVVRVPRPNRPALEAILRHYLQRFARDHQVADDVDLGEVAAIALGHTGADVERFVRGAARRARRERSQIAHRHLMAEVSGRPRRDSVVARLSPKQLERTAAHEAGHALAALLCTEHPTKPTLISIVPRGDSLGVTHLSDQHRGATTRRGHLEAVQVLLAGRAAESIVYGETGVSGGAGGSDTSDLARATVRAVEMICRLGMGDKSGLAWEGGSPGPARLEDVRALVSGAYAAVKRILERHREAFDELREVLVERQEMFGSELDDFVRRHALGNRGQE